jgi:hypothetical protein
MKAIPCARYAAYMALFGWNCKDARAASRNMSRMVRFSLSRKG